jgi:hypothetical protein
MLIYIGEMGRKEKIGRNRGSFRRACVYFATRVSARNCKRSWRSRGFARVCWAKNPSKNPAKTRNPGENPAEPKNPGENPARKSKNPGENPALGIFSRAFPARLEFFREQVCTTRFFSRASLHGFFVKVPPWRNSSQGGIWCRCSYATYLESDRNSPSGVMART